MVPTLDEVLETGRGRERSFNCHVHDDHNASASVNAETGLWLCYSCGARGKVGVPAPTTKQLAAMLDEQQVVPRVFPPSYLGAFTANSDYWVERIKDIRTVKAYGLGTHPVSGLPTFPVYTFDGLLVGCGERTGEEGMKYRYPRGFRASESFGRITPVAEKQRTLWRQRMVLVEGIADAAYLTAGFIPGVLACWGSSLHRPQAEYLSAMGVRTLLVGFDNDRAGDAGYYAMRAAYGPRFAFSRIVWQGKDPGDSPVEARVDAVRASLTRIGHDVLA